ncbi:MAG: SIMPL domain-containing protein [Myxococcota bacterium]
MQTRPTPFTLLTAAALVLFACSSLRTPSYADSPEAQTASGHVLVDGIASLQVIPDVVDMNLTLTAEDENPEKAVAMLQTQQKSLLAALRETTRDDAQLHAGHMQLSTSWREYGRDRERPMHTASLTVVVSLTVFERMGEVLAVGTAHGVTSAHSRYRSTQIPEKKKILREMALSAAANKAQQSATMMGVRLGPVTAIEELSRRTGWGSMALSNMEVAVNEPTGEGVLMPGAMNLSLSVEVRYALAD